MSLITSDTKTKVVDESDQILSELKEEIGILKNRICQVEEEQEESILTKQELQRQRKRYNDTVKQQARLSDTHDENFQILAEMMSHLKDPVNQVVGNLAHLTDEISDRELQDSLKECLETANHVLESFDTAENYCQTLGRVTSEKFIEMNLKEFLKKQLPLKVSPSESIKIFIDKQIPELIRVDAKLLKKTISLVLSEFSESLKKGNAIVIKAYRKADPDGYGLGEIKIQLNILAEQVIDMKWEGNWKDSIDISGGNSEKVPLEWLQCRNELHKANGDIRVLSRGKSVMGTEIQLPLENSRDC